METTETTTQPTNPRRWLLPVTAVAFFLTGLLVGVAVPSEDTEPLSAPEPAAQSTTEPAAETTPEPEPEPESEFAAPTEDDFILTVKTLEQKCFGSAGCNVSFRVEAVWFADFDPDATYEVTYEIRGGDDPLISTMTVEGDYYTTKDKERIGTPSSDAELTAVVIAISER